MTSEITRSLNRSITTSVDSIRFSESSVGCEAERRQLGVHGVVVVLLRLDAGVRHVVHAHVHPVVLACVAHLLGQVGDENVSVNWL